ncbi:MAG: FAD binding domain-containing protein, partial [Bacteroidetes bacterium]|nr:FAD binding domain-containing protein [Bacteroidota bacterium]
YIGAMTTVEDIKTSTTIKKIFPSIDKYFKLIASTPIRHRATLGGNIINASPIGDLTIFFLALNASIVLSNGLKKREFLLKNFFKDYKQLDKKKGEILEHLSFEMPDENSFFNFEKVSQRRHLDIASVNSAIQFQYIDGIIKTVNLSVGGVAPIPLYLSKTSEYLIGKEISNNFTKEASKIAQSEISPISDVRGSKEYKRLLTRQIIYSHFMTLCPEKIDLEVLF